jgi:hypothetical protein
MEKASKMIRSLMDELGQKGWAVCSSNNNLMCGKSKSRSRFVHVEPFWAGGGYDWPLWGRCRF